MWEEPSCWLEAYWKVPKPNPSLPAPLPSRGKKWAKREKQKQNWIKIFNMKLIYILVRKKYTHTDSKNFYSLSRVSNEKKRGWLVLNIKAMYHNAYWVKCSVTYTKWEFQSICSSHKGGDMSARISLHFPLSLFLYGTQWKALLIRGICWIIYCKHDNVIIVHAGPQGPAHFLLCVCRTAQIMHSAELH